jgi:hypothetical protein
MLRAHTATSAHQSRYRSLAAYAAQSDDNAVAFNEQGRRCDADWGGSLHQFASAAALSGADFRHALLVFALALELGPRHPHLPGEQPALHRDIGQSGTEQQDRSRDSERPDRRGEQRPRIRNRGFGRKANFAIRNFRTSNKSKIPNSLSNQLGYRIKARVPSMWRNSGQTALVELR